MSTKTIPAQTIKICDRCETEMKGLNCVKEGCLTLKMHALDMQGAACADATRKIDLCDSCLYHIAKALDAAMATAQEGGDAAKGA